MKLKKVLLIILLVIAVLFFFLQAGLGFVIWKLNSYSAGNWAVDSNVRDYIEVIYPDLDYKIVSREIYETEIDGRESTVWKLTVECDGESYTIYNISKQTSKIEPMYFNVADYAEIHFDYDEKIMDDVDELCNLGDYRMEYNTGIYTWSRYEFEIRSEENIGETVERIASVYDYVLAESKGEYPINIICVVRYEDREISFFTRDFYSDGQITMDRSERVDYIREKLN